jgi:cytochrome c-type biogenesis protein CcmF
MIAEMGHFALILALAVAIMQAVMPTLAAYVKDERLMAFARPLALGQFLLVTLSFFSLMALYVRSDFSVLTVAMNSHTAKPLLYKIAGVWGNHEGSLLLWAFMLTLFGASVALFGRKLSRRFRARVLSVQAMITIGFMLFMLLTSNPFMRLDPAPLDGQGLNPLLQDPGLAFHPPLLYLGYVGFSVAFSFAIAALIEGEVTPLWARWVRPWTLVAWSFLTGGIMLGSWWAYYELGWGGWWFWDPTENASFMPWLAGTALLHSVVVVEKREALKSWTVLLAIMTFSLSLLGTFLVRSGVVTSVHAFASDPERGMFILLFLGIVVGGSLLLYAIKGSDLEAQGQFKPISREGALVFNNLFLVTGLATVFFGTLYPLFVDALYGEKLTVGGPYFNATFVPLMMPLLIAMAISPFMGWKRADLWAVLGRLKFVLGISLLGAVLIGAMQGFDAPMALAGFAIAFWVAGSVLWELATRAKLFKGSFSNSMSRLKGLPLAHWGMSTAHMGVAILVMGITASETWTAEKLAIVHEGETISVGDYDFNFTGAMAVGGPNYTALRGHFDVTKKGEFVTQLQAEQRTYTAPPMTTTEAGIYSMVSGDLYAVVGEPDGAGGWQVRLYFKPLVSWMWFGTLLMMLGGFIAMADKRRRVAIVKRSKTKSGTSNDTSALEGAE